MNLYTGLLFLDGHIADPKLARSLAGDVDSSPSMPPDRRREPVARPPAVPRVSCRGAVASVCGAVSLSPFR